MSHGRQLSSQAGVSCGSRIDSAIGTSTSSPAGTRSFCMAVRTIVTMYMITDTSLRIREGLIVVRERTMTFANIQNLSICQGPLQRLLGIADLKVRTAGGGGGQGQGQGQAEKTGSANMHLGYFRGVDNAAEIRELAHDRRTLIFYESPRRMLRLLEELTSIFGNRTAVLAREMTKVHEEFVRGSLDELHQPLRSRTSLKGECTLLVAGSTRQPEIDLQALRQQLRSQIQAAKEPLSAVARKLAADHGLPRKRVYEEALRIQAETKRERKPSHG